MAWPSEATSTRENVRPAGRASIAVDVGHEGDTHAYYVPQFGTCQQSKEHFTGHFTEPRPWSPAAHAASGARFVFASPRKARTLSCITTEIALRQKASRK